MRVLGWLVTMVMAVALVSAPVRAAAAGPYQRGPDPTPETLRAERGPFEVARASVTGGWGSGFNKGTVYYPTSTAEGTFGAVAVMPGFTGPEFSVAWYGPRLASQGFVVLTLEPNSLFDFPDSRASQLLAALDHLAAKSTVKDRVDPARLAVMGHSMGGGGSLRAAERRPALKAAIPLAPWHPNTDWSKVTVPTMIFASDNDLIAPAGVHAEAFYRSLTAAPEKAYVLLNNAGHAQYILPDTTVAQYSIAWLKRYVDEDARYSQFLCPPPAPSATIERYEDTCPTGAPVL